MNYAGMTVNERLYVSGLIDKYYEAIEKKDIQNVVEILKAIDLNEDSIIPILHQNGLIDK